MKTVWPIAAAALVAACPAAAHDILPESVRDMVEAAIATGNSDKVATVVELATQLYPGNAEEIAAMHDAFRQRKAALAAAQKERELREIRQAGLFDRWTGKGELGGFVSTGNNDQIGLTAGLRLDRDGIDWRHKFRALVDYQESNGRLTREQVLVAYEPQINIGDRLFAYGLAQYQRDRFQGFWSRYSVSGGVGYQAIAGDDLTLSLKAGPAFRHSDLVDGGTRQRLSGLAASDLDWAIADNIALTQDASAYLELENTSLNAVTGLEAKLTDRLTARLSYAVEHDTDPPPGAVTTDTLTRMTVVYGF